jgi:hypothetical protein
MWPKICTKKDSAIETRLGFNFKVWKTRTRRMQSEMYWLLAPQKIVAVVVSVVSVVVTAAGSCGFLGTGSLGSRSSNPTMGLTSASILSSVSPRIPAQISVCYRDACMIPTSMAAAAAIMIPHRTREKAMAQLVLFSFHGVVRLLVAMD